MHSCTSGGTHFAILFVSWKSESGAAVAQLRKACDPIEGSFVLDLSNLLFADDAGIDVIHTIVEEGAGVRGASPFVQLLLDGATGI